MKTILTCEHAGNIIPKKHKELFAPFQLELKSHKGLDLGALDLFESLIPMTSFHFQETMSRLLIELNRSLHHRDLFSHISKSLSSVEKKHLIETIYKPYRQNVESQIWDFINQGEEVLHLSIHTFTPILNLAERNCDMGILYDPKRNSEKQFAQNFKSQLSADSNLKVRLNYPYKGSSDGFTTYLRKVFPKHYLGIELEVNQKFVIKNIMNPSIKNIIGSSLSTMLLTP